jgi:hypothetical protein
VDEDAPHILDEAIVRIINRGEGTVDDLFTAMHGRLGLRRLDEGPAAFLRTLRRGPEGDLIASTLLRLLAGRYQAIDDSQVRHQAVEFLDNHYGDSLRPYYRRPRKRNAYEVLNALAPVVPCTRTSSRRPSYRLTQLGQARR